MVADEIRALEEIKPKVYKARGIVSMDISAGILSKKSALKCAIKMCDGSFHLVNSELQEALEKNKELVKAGHYDEILQAIPKEARSSRFVVWQKDAEAYLLGDIETALKKLSGK